MPDIAHIVNSVAGCPVAIQGFFQWTPSVTDMWGPDGPGVRGDFAFGADNTTLVEDPNVDATPSCAPARRRAAFPVRPSRERADRRSLRRDVLTLAIAGAIGLGWLSVWLYGSGSLPWLQSWYDVRAATLSAGSLGVGASVTIAGIKVGRVTSITQQGDGAVIGMEIEQKYGPLARDSRFGVRLRTIVGENYVALYPGRGTAMLSSGGLLGPRQDVEQVDVDQILSTLQGGTRAHVQKLIEGFGGGLDGRGTELNSLVGEASGLVVSSAPVTQVLAQDHAEVSRLTDELGELSAAIGRRGADVEQIATGAQKTFTSIATRDTALAQTLERLPAAIAQVRQTTATLRAVTGSAAPVLGNLAVAVDDLDPAVHTLLPAARIGTTVVDELGRTAPALETTLAHVRNIAPPAAAALPQLHALLCQTTPAVRYLSPYWREAPALLEAMGSATNFYFAASHAARLYVTVGEDSIKFFSPPLAAAVHDLANQGAIGIHDTLAYNPFPAPGDAGETYSPSDPSGYLADHRPYPRIHAAC